MNTIITTKGFTLIEVIVVAAMIVIMASIALPAYQDSLIKTRRSDAQAALIGLASALERHHTSNFTYAEAAQDGNKSAPKASIYPSQVPIDGEQKYYDLTIHSADATAFEIRATPIADTAQDGDGFLSLDHLGNKLWDKNTDDTAEENW